MVGRRVPPNFPTILPPPYFRAQDCLSSQRDAKFSEFRPGRYLKSFQGGIEKHIVRRTMRDKPWVRLEKIYKDIL
jgi:hypothetical protein